MYEKAIQNFKIARLVLSGALVGIALGNLLGIDASALVNLGDQSKELLNAMAGASVTAAILKAVHIV